MSKVTPIYTQINAGELSPLLEGRVDIGKYPNGLQRCEGFIPLIQGPAMRRAGTRMVKPVKAVANRTWLIPFVFSSTDGWILEFGDRYIRFYTNRAQVLLAGVAYEIVTPYLLADLTAADGTFRINFVQSADVVYLVHPSYPIQKLSRFAATNWTIVPVETTAGPFQDININKANTVYASASTGAITLTSSSAIFLASQIGTLFFLESNPNVVITPWESGKAFAVNAIVRSDGNVYQAQNAATSSGIKPTHTEGTRSDGGVNWLYLHSGYGWARITGITSALIATADVVSYIPGAAVTAGNATYKWAFSAIGAHAGGYPSHVTFFRERLVFARGDRLWFSVSGDYENFASKDADTVTADRAISLQIASDQVSTVQWLAPSNGLIVGTTGPEFVVGEITTSDPLGPNNVKASPQSAYGSRNVPAIRVGAAVLFLQRAGKKMREIKYDFNSDAYISIDDTVLAAHITGPGVVAMAFQLEPDSVIWAARSDGLLIGFTFNREQDVLAWHRHPIGGNGIVESVATIPSPDGTRDDLWIIVRRTINGVSQRYIEFLEKPYETGDLQSSCFYVDSGATYSGAPATVIAGLGHLEGETVSVLVDGATHPNRVVQGGSITLQLPGSVVHAGYAFRSLLETMRIEAGAQAGTSQGKTKRISHAVIRYINTLGGKAGPNENSLNELQFRSPQDPMDKPPPIFNGDKQLPWPAGYETDGRMVFVQEQPLPMIIAAIMPEVQTNER